MSTGLEGIYKHDRTTVGLSQMFIYSLTILYCGIIFFFFNILPLLVFVFFFLIFSDDLLDRLLKESSMINLYLKNCTLQQPVRR